ncbi:MAG: hypothetical protein DHS20C18_20020 [Saprospiraceae bacterium]|nr:MAG: hypothetical protein DHS20C18_20020 [Saprospiraceae bacterium]
MVTDLHGKFKLSVPKECVTLVVSSIGFNTKELKNACVGQSLNIVLEEGVNLEEVVVTNEGKAKRAKKDRAAKESERRLYAAPLNRSDFAMASGMSITAPMDQPLHNTEDYDVINENRFFEVTQNPLSTFSIDVDAAAYSNLRRFVNNGQLPPKDAVRIEEMVNYFDYQYPGPQSEHPFEVVTEISDCPWQPEHKLLHVGLQGKRIETENLPASNLVFLIDVSGSMSAPNKLPLLQASYKLLTDQLRPQDKVAIVVYAGAAGLVLPSTSGANKPKIKEAIDQLQAGGSTAGGAGIQLAYKIAKENFVKGGNNRVILATDGDFNVGASSDAEMVRMIEEKRESGVFLTVMGFGMGNYKDNKMQQLANKGNGNHAYIDNINEAKKVLVNEFGGTMFTIAKDVKLQIEFNPANVAGYRLIGYENRLLNKEDFNDDKKDAGELGAGHTVTAMYEIIPAGVESKFLASVDDLKYQDNKVKVATKKSAEFCTIKLRYKEPDGTKSQLIEKPVMDNKIALDETSDNFRWAAAVGEFGMLLRESEFLGNATYVHCKKLAESAKGMDKNGYRMEMIRMLDVVGSLVNPELAGKE